jgi:hypothetical protein
VLGVPFELHALVRVRACALTNRGNGGVCARSTIELASSKKKNYRASLLHEARLSDDMRLQRLLKHQKCSEIDRENLTEARSHVRDACRRPRPNSRLTKHVRTFYGRVVHAPRSQTHTYCMPSQRALRVLYFCSCNNTNKHTPSRFSGVHCVKVGSQSLMFGVHCLKVRKEF